MAKNLLLIHCLVYILALGQPASADTRKPQIWLERTAETAKHAVHSAIAAALNLALSMTQKGTSDATINRTVFWLTAEIGDSYFTAQNYQEALRYQERATILADQLFGEHSRESAERLASQVLTLYFLSNYEKATPLAERSLNLSIAIWGPHSLKTAERQGDLALLYSYSDRNEEASILADKALKTRIHLQGLENEDTIEQIRQYAEAGRNLPLGLEKGIQLDHIALALSERFVGWNSIRTETILNDLGFFYRQNFECDKALPYTREALAVALEIEDPNSSEVANRYHSLGTNLFCLGDMHGAIRMTEKALDISRLHFGEKHMAVAYLEAELADWYTKVADDKASRALAGMALSTLDETMGDEHPNAPDIFDFVGSAARSWDVDLSIRLSRRYLNVMRLLYGDADIALVDPLINISKGLLITGDVRNALKMASRASDLTLGYAAAHHTLPEEEALEARVLAELIQGMNTAAERHALQALSFSEKKLGLNHPENAVYYHLLAKSVRNHDHALAITLAKRGLNLLEQSRSNLATFNIRPEPLDKDPLNAEKAILAKWLREDLRLDEAGILDAGKVPSLTEHELSWLNQYDDYAARRKRMDLPLRTLKQQVESGSVSQKDIALTKSLEDRTIKTLRSFETFYRSHPLKSHDNELASLHPSLPIRDIQQRLMTEETNTAWLHHEFLPEELRLTVVTKAGTTTFSTPGKAETLLRQLNRALVDLVQPAEEKRTARELYRMLLEPAMETLREESIDSIFIDADTPAAGIPFSALHDGTSYVVRSLTTAYLHGSGRSSPKIHFPARVAAFGSGSPQGSMTGLPMVGAELKAITAPTERGDWYGIATANLEFDRSHIKAASRAGFTILHIASHFILSHDHEEESSILLGDGRYLSETELVAILKKGSPLDLITLSACDSLSTDISNTQTERTQPKLINALIHLGTGHVLGALWPIEDRDSLEVMTQFYEHIKNDHNKPAKALQLALKDWSFAHSPGHWAPFVLHLH